MKAFNWLGSLISCTKGNAMVVAAAAMPIFIGAAAIGVDSIQVSLARRQLQRAADAGALAGAYALVQSKSPSAAVDYDLSLNNRVALSATRVVENAPTVGTYKDNTKAVRVVLTAQRSTPFMGFFKRSNISVQVEATAAVVYTGKFCMVSLEAGNATGVTFTGSTSVDLGCGVATNSKSSSAIVAGGSATVTASPIAAVGGVPSSSGYATGTQLMPYSPTQSDPFANLPRTPSPPADCTDVSLDSKPNQTITIASNVSGNYCVRGGADIKGNTNLAPGTYYVDSGTLAFGSQANVVGKGITFILTSSNFPTKAIASISMHGGAVVDLEAPKTGTYKDLIMYQDPRATAGNGVTINGNTSSTYIGGLYFPNADLTFNGNTGMNTQCLQLVARRLTFSGNSSVTNECPTDGGGKAFDAIFVRLVG